jgi:protein-tyrosine phosphatase
MIDIHSHILPGFDDGAGSMEEAIEMLRVAAAAGTTDIVASSHSNAEFAFDPVRAVRRIAELQQAARDIPRIHYGCELHFTLENVEAVLRSPKTWSINHRGYVLIEFSDFVVPKTSGEILARLGATGTRPVLVHPERNRILQKNLPELESWIRHGSFVQVTVQSLLGRFGRSAKTAGEYLLNHGMVHFLASDAHDVTHRPPVLTEGWSFVEERFGTETAERLLVTNPQAALSGAPIHCCDARARRKAWYSLR